jgi:hypothetical protein
MDEPWLVPAPFRQAYLDPLVSSAGIVVEEGRWMVDIESEAVYRVRWKRKGAAQSGHVLRHRAAQYLPSVSSSSVDSQSAKP